MMAVFLTSPLLKTCLFQTTLMLNNKKKTALTFKKLFYSNHTKRAIWKKIIMKHVIWLDSACLVYSIYL